MVSASQLPGLLDRLLLFLPIVPFKQQISITMKMHCPKQSLLFLPSTQALKPSSCLLSTE